MDTWPASLPCCPIRRGQAIQPVENRVVFQPDAGPPMYRQKTTLQQFILPWNFFADAGQIGVFRTFFHTILRDGSKRFEAMHPRLGVVKQFMFEGPYSEEEIDPGRLYFVTSQVRQVS